MLKNKATSPSHTSENKMALYNIASTVIVAGVNFFTIPVFTRMLDTDGYGVVSIYIAWTQICTILIGLKSDGSIGSAHANLSEDEQDSYQWSALLMGLASFVVVFILSVVFIDPLSGLLAMNDVLIVSMLLQSLGTFVVSLFSMRFIFGKEPQKNFVMSVGICVITTLASVALVASGIFGVDAYMGRVLGLSLPYLLAGLGLLFAMACYSPSFRLSYWKFCLLLTLPLVFHGLSQILLSQTGKIVVQQYAGNSMAGIYSIAVTVVSLMNAIYTALNNAFVPFMYDDLAGKTTHKKKCSHFRNYFMLFTLGSCAFALMSPEVLKLLSTEEYWEATRLLPILVLGQYCVFLYSFPVNYEFFKMRTASIAVGTTLAALLNVAVCWMLVPRLGMDGAAIATAVAYLALFVFHFCIARFFLGDRNYSVWVYIVGLVSVGATCALCVLLEESSFTRWALGFMCLCVALVGVFRRKSIF